jgi:hypothetical protein
MISHSILVTLDVSSPVSKTVSADMNHTDSAEWEVASQHDSQSV